MQKQTRTALKMALALFLLASATSLVASLLSASFTIPTTGQVAGVGVSVSPNTLNWGAIAPGTQKTLLVQVTNTGNVPVMLSMATQNMPSYLTLAWNCTGATVPASQSISASFTLTASAQAPQGANFAFNITITGTGGE